MNKEVFLRKMSRLMFWKYRRSEIKDILDDFSEYIDIAVSKGENEADIVNRLGSLKNIVNEPDIQTIPNLGTIRKLAAIVLLLYFFICLMAGNSNPYFLTSITFCIVFPLLLLFVLGGEISSVSTFKLAKGYYFLFWSFPIVMLCFWLISYFSLTFVSEPGITDLKKYIVSNFGVILSFFIKLELIVGIAILLILARLYLKYQYNIYNTLTIWSGAIGSIFLLRHYFRNLSSPDKIMYNMLICLTPFIISLVIVLTYKFLFYFKKGKAIWMHK